MLSKDILAFKPYQIQASSLLEVSTHCRKVVYVGQVIASQEAFLGSPCLPKGLFCNWALQC